MRGVIKLRGGLDSHLGVKEADGSLDNGRLVVENDDGDDVAIAVGNNGSELDHHILGLLVEGEGEWESLLLASLNLGAVLHRGDVVQDGLVGRSFGRELLGVLDVAGDEGDDDWASLLVLNINEGIGRAAVQDLDAKNVRVGEARLDLRIEGGRLSGRGGLGVGLD